MLSLLFSQATYSQLRERALTISLLSLFPFLFLFTIFTLQTIFEMQNLLIHCDNGDGSRVFASDMLASLSHEFQPDVTKHAVTDICLRCSTTLRVIIPLELQRIFISRHILECPRTHIMESKRFSFDDLISGDSDSADLLRFHLLHYFFTHQFRLGSLYL
ncbi:Hypothetical_protein [Hexamita inflata]|uniref:Hypothetical_protein n=1 Tax=Hexamita inflata TaxID=28002 RepID=A0ABP1H2T9_9EUKA